MRQPGFRGRIDTDSLKASPFQDAGQSPPQVAVHVVEASANKAKCPVLPLDSDLINRWKILSGKAAGHDNLVRYSHRGNFAASSLDAGTSRVKTEKISAKHVRAC